MFQKYMSYSLFLLAMVFFLSSCAGVQDQPSASNFKQPDLILEMLEVPQYDGYWYYSKGVEPTKGEPGDRGAPLPMSFLFNVENPNPYTVSLEGIRFTVSFEGFELITVNNSDEYLIPGNSIDQIRINTMITARSALLSLLVTGGFKLKEKGWSPWDALERWWTGVPNYEVPVTLKDGSATFAADGITKVVPFELNFP